MPSLGRRTLQELRRVVVGHGIAFPGTERGCNCLLFAIDTALKTRRSIKAARVRGVAKKKTRKEETAALRAEVFKRADGRCEICGAEATDLDHFWGRKHAAQTVENCVAMCRPCHRAKTDNKPSRSYWLSLFYQHVTTHGFGAEAAKIVRAEEVDALKLQGRATP